MFASTLSQRLRSRAVAACRLRLRQGPRLPALLAPRLPILLAPGLLLPALPALRASAQQSPTPSGGSPQSPAKPGAPDLQPGAVMPYEVNLQATLIDQNLFRFRSPYEGRNSLKARSENEKSDTYTLYLGVRLFKEFEAFLNPEMARGNGISTALGLAGFTNGDVIRNPTLGQNPYLARYFVRGTLALGRRQEDIAPGENQIVGTRPVRRVVMTGGRLGTNDIFDTNAYANSTRTQFMNWALINNGAYDYAADTRGYSQGVAVEWLNPNFAVRVGSFQMPKIANGTSLAPDLIHSRGDQLEVELHPVLARRKGPFIARLLAYRNFANMGDYRQSLTLAQHTGTTPDITATRRRGNVKYGFGFNFEQPLGDEGGTALFGRAGWDDGKSESFAYTEIDRTVCVGGQLSGRRWHRRDDRLALAVVQNDLSGAHRDYLAAGGLGFLLGDGRLRYGPEQIVETYYSLQIAKPLALSLDYQFVNNPGYNRDRGPVSVVSVRVHLEL